ncbi:MAG: enoyl-CoA hydratase/isomerase family protein [Pirellulales bacterium]|nr:enoyl-CoA hydratase/isomerase family protein [Pirellulales bacterium]
MKYLDLSLEGNIVTVTIQRPKVNALNEELVDELNDCFRELSKDKGVKAVVLTGQGSFFSFGFDVPGFMDYKKKAFERYVRKFSKLTQQIFLFQKPVIAGLNGHAIAGGCILALSCDYRVMVKGKPKISLNEVTFGSTVFSSVAEYLRFAAGSGNAQKILYSGKMYSAEEALSLGLIDQAVSQRSFASSVHKIALEYAARDKKVFRSVKKLLRSETYKKIEKNEKRTITEFVDIWYSKSTRAQLAKIEIRD